MARIHRCNLESGRAAAALTPFSLWWFRWVVQIVDYLKRTGGPRAAFWAFDSLHVVAALGLAGVEVNHLRVGVSLIIARSFLRLLVR